MQSPQRLLQILRAVSVVLMVLTSMWAFVHILTVINRFQILANAKHYTRAVFRIEKLTYYSDSEGSDRWWADGTVNGVHPEDFSLHLYLPVRPRSQEDVEKHFHVGQELPVYYNPKMTRTIMQNETLRVLPATEDLPDQEWKRLKHLGNTVVLPLLLALGLIQLLFKGSRRS